MKYETVFPDDRVQGIDLVISEADWQAMLEEVSSIGMGERVPAEGAVPEGPPAVCLRKRARRHGGWIGRSSRRARTVKRGTRSPFRSRPVR